MNSSEIITLIITMVLSFSLGLFLRRWYHAREIKRLVRDLEQYFASPLPQLKKGKSSQKINWERVLKMLRNEPTTGQVAHWKELVKKQITTASRTRHK